jgi:hypothetical protein
MISRLFLPKQLTRVPGCECPLALPEQARHTGVTMGGPRRLFAGSHDQPTYKFALASRRKKFLGGVCLPDLSSSI